MSEKDLRMEAGDNSMEKEQQSVPEEFLALQGKSIFVTGASGFIGNALFRRLAGYGLDVKGSVLLESEAEQMQREGFDVCILDLRSNSDWDRYLQDIDIVFHIAAIFQEVEKPFEEYDTVNHLAVAKLAKAAVAAGVERFVHCSTVGVHGDVLEIPASEDTPYNPMDPYHKTKLDGELALMEFGRSLPSNGMTITINRPAMVYGPGDLRLLKIFKAIAKRRFIMIGNGETLAHLNYIEDVIDSLLLCAVRPRDDVHLQAFNIASGDPLTLNEMAKLISNSTGVPLLPFKIPISLVWTAALLCEALWKPFGARPPLYRRRVGFFTHNRSFDLTKARRQLAYESQWSADRGIPETVAWYKQNDLLP
jgi:nucleoside-diphosphate-sugar epimerase